jgi:Melibiase
MDAPGAQVTLGGEGLGLEWQGLVSWRRLQAGLRLKDGGEYRSAAWSPSGAGDGRFFTDCGPVRLELRLGESAAGWRLQLRADHSAGGPSEKAEVVELSLAGELVVSGSSPRWLLYNGYQSWDRAGCVPVTTPGDGQSIRNDSWWTAGIADEGGAGLAAASAAPSSLATRFVVTTSELRLVWSEAAVPAPAVLFSHALGQEWTSPEVLLSAGPDVRRSLARIVTGRIPAPRVLGWLSWYHFGPFVARDHVLQHSELLADGAFTGMGYSLVQVDDGWQQAYGEWEPNTKFPGGLAALAREIEQRGQCLGIWTAPFLVSASAGLAETAPPDWFVVDPATGERLVDERHQVFGPMHVLDASQPAVQDHLRDLFAAMYEAGARHFKIDFLYAGGYAGSRALAAGLAAIKEGARDAYLVASGAPLGPVAGFLHCCRIGPDTATPLVDFETWASRPTVFGDEVVDVGRNLAARHFLDGWFRLDADVALVGGNLTLEQGRQLVTMAALSGGPFLASDDLLALSEERLELLTNSDVLKLVGTGPAVPDWEPNHGDLPPVHWRLGDVLAVFNWTPQDAELQVKAPGAAGASELGTGSRLPDFRDGTALSVPANGVRLLRLDTA